MKLVSFKTLDAAIELVSTIDSDEDMIKLTDGLFEGQPDLAQFLVDFAEDLNEEAQDLIVIMGLIIWRSVVATYGTLRAMPEEEVISLYEAFEAAMPDDENITEEWFVSLIKNAEEFCQPEVFKYIIAELFQDAPEDSTLTDVENTQLTLGLRFFTQALNELAKEAK
ncbi:hypothetical protein [Bdellovibrio svalbardensis]|uniref:DUF1186 domain-containing protein n=1 Tax=Bdellovibrio svalbardensis TaxID=2972972 RepID=A0ABT6DES7_9BACT|nr:hypothetical protein [Bdellovibrio svalbardensis]MDG0815293.1 hypothetical protein [Bdellovibrio svalbardensis]